MYLNSSAFFPKAFSKKGLLGLGGGFILSSGSHIDMVKPENVRAMIESAKEYGIYV